jgi:hypothetical protein
MSDEWSLQQNRRVPRRLTHSFVEPIAVGVLNGVLAYSFIMQPLHPTSLEIESVLNEMN